MEISEDCASEPSAKMARIDKDLEEGTSGLESDTVINENVPGNEKETRKCKRIEEDLAATLQNQEVESTMEGANKQTTQSEMTETTHKSDEDEECKPALVDDGDIIDSEKIIQKLDEDCLDNTTPEESIQMLDPDVIDNQDSVKSIQNSLDEDGLALESIQKLDADYIGNPDPVKSMHDEEDVDEIVDEEEPIKPEVIEEELIEEVYTEPDYSYELSYFSTETLTELASYSWDTSIENQQYTKGCLWSPDGTCCLVGVNGDGRFFFDTKYIT